MEGILFNTPYPVFEQKPYSLLEYIESTGTQYIDTDIAANIAREISLPLEFTDVTVNNFNIPFAAQNASQPYYAIGIRYRKTTSALDKLDLSGVGAYGPISADTLYAFKLTYAPSSTGRLYNGGTQLTSVSFSSINSQKVYIGALNSGGAYAAGSWCKFHSAEIKTSSLVRDYKPCILTSAVTDYFGNPQAAGAVGMWDMASDKFFPNAGTGSFIAGPPIE